MSTEACCTCASLLTTTPTPSILSEKPAVPLTTPARRLPCCSRSICATCLSQTPRFETYCPFCQVSNGSSPLPQGLRDPPAYTPSQPPTSDAKTADGPEDATNDDQAPPPYSPGAAQEDQQPDVTHYLRPSDTLPALSLAYRVPLPILRSHNTLWSDSLLPARRKLQIPRAHYTGPSLSPNPVESEEETERKSAIRRFMVGAKCHEYDVAELYLGQAGGDVDVALDKWIEDERWERENPYKKNGKGKDQGSRAGGRRGGSGLVGQLR